MFEKSTLYFYLSIIFIKSSFTKWCNCSCSWVQTFSELFPPLPNSFLLLDLCSFVVHVTLLCPPPLQRFNGTWLDLQRLQQFMLKPSTTCVLLLLVDWWIYLNPHFRWPILCQYCHCIWVFDSGQDCNSNLYIEMRCEMPSDEILLCTYYMKLHELPAALVPTISLWIHWQKRCSVNQVFR